MPNAKRVMSVGILLFIISDQAKMAICCRSSSMVAMVCERNCEIVLWTTKRIEFGHLVAAKEIERYW
jgi:hypothetical protein